LETETIRLFEFLYNTNIDDEYDSEASPIAEDDNDDSHGFGFIDNIWKVRYSTTMDQIRSIASPSGVGAPVLVLNVLDSDSAS